jgi:hypothetical protein
MYRKNIIITDIKCYCQLYFKAALIANTFNQFNFDWEPIELFYVLFLMNFVLEIEERRGVCACVKLSLESIFIIIIIIICTIADYYY